MIRLPPRRPQRAARFARLRGRLPPLPPPTAIVRSAAPFGHLAALRGRQAGPLALVRRCGSALLRGALCSLTVTTAPMAATDSEAHGCEPGGPIRLRWRNSKAVRSKLRYFRPLASGAERLRLCGPSHKAGSHVRLHCTAAWPGALLPAPVLFRHCGPLWGPLGGRLAGAGACRSARGP